MKRQNAQNTNNQLQTGVFDNINPSQTRIAPYFQVPSDTTKKVNIISDMIFLLRGIH